MKCQKRRVKWCCFHFQRIITGSCHTRIERLPAMHGLVIYLCVFTIGYLNGIARGKPRVWKWVMISALEYINWKCGLWEKLKRRETYRALLSFAFIKLHCTTYCSLNYCAKQICISDKIRIIDQSLKFKVQNCILHLCVHW